MKALFKILSLACLLGLVSIVPAMADCTSPAAQEGDIRYDSTAKNIFFCNGTDWREVDKKPVYQLVNTPRTTTGDTVSATFYSTCPAGSTIVATGGAYTSGIITPSGCHCTSSSGSVQAGNNRTVCSHGTSFTTGSCPNPFCTSTCRAVCEVP